MEKFISTVKAFQEMQIKAIEKGFVRFDVNADTSNNCISVAFKATDNDETEYMSMYISEEKDFTKSRRYEFLQFCLNHE